MMIPNEISAKFGTARGRKEMIRLYGGRFSIFTGINGEGEEVMVDFKTNGITLRTNQSNGWVQVLYYDENGELEGESYDGRWKEKNDET